MHENTEKKMEERDGIVKQFFGMSQRGDLREAVRGLSRPQLILLMSNNSQFEKHVKELEELYPQVPSIGCIGMCYDTRVAENGVGVVAFYDGVSAAANVLEQVSVMPVKYIKRMEDDIKKVNASQSDTVCIDFCSGNDACVLTTLYTALRRRDISLVGGTGDGGKVSAKENIYHQMGDYRFIASNTDRAKYSMGALNGKPARQVYQDILRVTEQQILTQTFKNPFGKLNGDETCIISIKEVSGSALACFRQVNDSDVLVLLELGDYKQIVKETIQKICRDFPRRSAVFSVNCLFRYKLFSENGYMEEYLREMKSLGNHAGLVGYGEHYNNQFVNQSMTCVVFE